MKCYISKNYRNLGNAGDKAKTDIELIMDRLGFKNIGRPQTRSKNSVKAYLNTLFSVLKGVSSISKGDILVLQYPLKKYYDFVVDKAVSKGAKVITVIHDLGSFRRKALSVKQEIERLNHADRGTGGCKAQPQLRRNHPLSRDGRMAQGKGCHRTAD